MTKESQDQVFETLADQMDKGVLFGFMKLAKASKSFAFAISSISAVLDKSEELWREQECAQRNLTAALSRNNYAAGFSAANLQDYATRLQKETSIPDEKIMDTISRLSNYKNIKGGVFKDAVRMSLNADAALGPGSTKIIGAALNSPFEASNKLAYLGLILNNRADEIMATFQKQGDFVGAQDLLLEALSQKFKGSIAASQQPEQGFFGKSLEKLRDLGTVYGSEILSGKCWARWLSDKRMRNVGLHAKLGVGGGFMSQEEANIACEEARSADAQRQNYTDNYLNTDSTRGYTVCRNGSLFKPNKDLRQYERDHVNYPNLLSNKTPGSASKPMENQTKSEKISQNCSFTLNVNVPSLTDAEIERLWRIFQRKLEMQGFKLSEKK